MRISDLNFGITFYLLKKYWSVTDYNVTSASEFGLLYGTPAFIIVASYSSLWERVVYIAVEQG
jgi:hypothetical protein